MLALAYHRSAGVNAIIVRPCAVYGRGGFLGGAQHGRRINDLLLAALHEPIGGSEISVDVPTAERVYAFDAALAIREAVFVEKPTTRIYNVGSGEVVTPASLAAAINAAVPGARAVGAAREDSPVRTLDTTLARLELAYTPQWPLQHAVADYVSSLRTHGPYPG
jgi:nucleoside-diphosphate-sugar epimerase